jgi:hypothetical protein
LQLIADPRKGGKWLLPLEERGHVGEPASEAVEHDQDEGTVEDSLTLVTKRIGHAFEMTTVVRKKSSPWIKVQNSALMIMV